MKRHILVSTLTAGMLLAGAGVALAQTGDTSTGGVTQAVANAACAGVAGKTKPANAAYIAAVNSYNTTSPADDAAFSAIPVEWQKFIQATEDHIDYLAMNGLDNAKSFTCAGEGGTATFPELKLSAQVGNLVCANARLDLIANVDLRGKVDAALKVLDRSFADAHSDCAPATTTPPPATTTTTVPPTSTPRPADLDCNDFPLPDGRTAQDVLLADLTDPNVLDANNNKIACEAADGFDPSAPNGDGPIVSDSDNVVPDVSDGIATGLA